MKHSNISIFVSHEGCPNKCAFCNQHTISGHKSLPDADDVKEICNNALRQVSDKKNCEIAFFGGSFTAINREYMISLLETASQFVGEEKFKGIRISTRPDCIDEEVLEVLKKYKVSAIELGAQSMSDEVLFLNDRGHTADDVKNASQLIKSYGFELGLQMMTGLYGSDTETDSKTADEIIKLKPDTVRIYPTVILENTRLAELYRSGIYKPYEFDKAVVLCAELLMRFEKENIRVIKLGLHASELVEGEMIGGFYHPAFRELCEGEIFKKKISELLFDGNFPCKSATVAINPKNISKAVGQNRKNLNYFMNKGVELKIQPDDKLLDRDVILIEKR
ncbi:MAG: radical SAM protein [Ruminococcus sp.]|nr:radical SAM protein [Ruminococcus sp.]